MSYSTTRYGRQSVSGDESLVSYVQNPRFDVSDSDAESYLGPDEATYLDHDEARYLDHDEARYLDHDEARYLDHDEETDSSDGGQDDPRCYGICPGEFAPPDAISNEDYRRGNDNFNYIKAYWPETIPRHYTWDGKYPEDERWTLVALEEKIWGIRLRDMHKSGHWVPYTITYREHIVPYIATITYSDSNPLVTLSYALLREPSGKVSVVGVKLDPAPHGKITVVSRWYVVDEGEGGTNTDGILGFDMPPTPRRDGMELEWSADLCEWWVPHYSLRDTLHFPPDEVDERSYYWVVKRNWS
ncbi:hypothetical protein MAJ_09040, partial [Metarhizium majus ARSEF 297]